MFMHNCTNDNPQTELALCLIPVSSGYKDSRIHCCKGIDMAMDQPGELGTVLEASLVHGQMGIVGRRFPARRRRNENSLTL